MGMTSDPLTLFRLHGLPDPETEFRFHKTRKWRWDFAFCPTTFKIAVEKQGGVMGHGHHTRPRGYADDCEKLAEGQLAGWIVIFATTQQLASGQAIEWIKRALKERGWEG